MKVFLSIVAGLQCYGYVYCGDIFFTPHDSCDDLSPEAAPTPKNGHSPIIIDLSSYKYNGGEPITVTVSTTNGDEFVNVLIRTHCTSCSDPRVDVGRFSKLGEELDTFDCGGVEESAVLATEYQSRRSFTMVWIPNPYLNEELYIEGSVIVDPSTWWNGIKSELIIPNSASSRQKIARIFKGVTALLCLNLILYK